jgi:hypothetical protein
VSGSGGLSPSDSGEQQAAEEHIRMKVSEHLGRELSKKRIKLDGGAVMEVDGVTADESTFVEIFSHQGSMKGGQRHKIATDAFKLVTLGRSRPEATLILALAHPDAVRFATQRTWIAEALKEWGVEVLEVELDETATNELVKAQVRQVMVNPA